MAEEKEVKVEEGEKKENAFSKFWKKTKQSVSDSILESKIKSMYEKSKTEYTIYKKGELFNQTVYGSIEENVLTIFGKEELEAYNLVVEEKSGHAYFIVGIEENTVMIEYDGTVYERPAMRLTLDADVEEVDVIKAGKRYFLYKGPKKNQK